MKLDYIVPELELICLVSAQKLADTTDATIPFDNFQSGDIIEPGDSYIIGDTEVDIPIW